MVSSPAAPSATLIFFNIEGDPREPGSETPDPSTPAKKFRFPKSEDATPLTSPKKEAFPKRTYYHRSGIVPPFQDLIDSETRRKIGQGDGPKKEDQKKPGALLSLVEKKGKGSE